MRGGKRRVQEFRKALAEAFGTAPAETPLDRRNAIRAAKALRLSFGLDPELPLEDLDLVLPPVECARTKERLGRGEPAEGDDRDGELLD